MNTAIKTHNIKFECGRKSVFAKPLKGILETINIKGWKVGDMYNYKIHDSDNTVIFHLTITVPHPSRA